MPPDAFGGGLRPPPTALWVRHPAHGEAIRPGRGRSPVHLGEGRGPAFSQGEVRLTVEVRPRASRNEIVARVGTGLRVRVTAPPVGGAANDAVRELLARALGCPRAAVEILRGYGSRTKLVRVTGLSPDELRSRLATVG